LDGDKKSSKGLGNAIHLSDQPDEVKKKVMRMYTDPKRVRADIPGTVEGNPVFVYHDAFNPNTAEVEDLKARYRAGKVGDVEVKTKLAHALNAYLEPIRERRSAVLAKPDRLQEILFEGSKRARVTAVQTMGGVRAARRRPPKSTTRPPRPETAAAVEGALEADPPDALVRRLREHQNFKAAAGLLHEREQLRAAQWQRPDERVAAIAGDDYEPELEVDLFSLSTSFQEVVSRSKLRPNVFVVARQISLAG